MGIVNMLVLLLTTLIISLQARHFFQTSSGEETGKLKSGTGSKEEGLQAEEDFMESLSDKDEMPHHASQYRIYDDYEPCRKGHCDPIFYDCSTCKKLHQ